MATKKADMQDHDEYSDVHKRSGTPLLEEAASLIGGARRTEYGDTHESFSAIAAMWSVVLGTEVSPLQVIQCMVALKLCRSRGAYHRDSYVDMAGYAALAEQIAEGR